MPSWAQELLSGSNTYLYPVIFILLVLCGLGFPMSADLVLITCGILIYQGHADLAILIPLCMSSILLSDYLMFNIGKYGGRKVIHVWPFRKIFTETRLSKAQCDFDAYGYGLVFLARFMPGFRTVVFFTSGLMNLKTLRFLAYDFVGACITIPGILYSVSWAAGETDKILPLLARYQWIFFGAAAVFIVYQLRAIRRRRALQRTSSVPAVERT